MGTGQYMQTCAWQSWQCRLLSSLEDTRLVCRILILFPQPLSLCLLHTQRSVLFGFDDVRCGPSELTPPHKPIPALSSQNVPVRAKP